MNAVNGEFEYMLITVNEFARAGRLGEASLMFDNAEQFAEREGIKMADNPHDREISEMFGMFRKIKIINGIIDSTARGYSVNY